MTLLEFVQKEYEIAENLYFEKKEEGDLLAMNYYDGVSDTYAKIENLLSKDKTNNISEGE